MRYIVIAIALLIAGCTTSPVQVESAAEVDDRKLHAYQDSADGLAEIVILRDSGALGSACDVTVFVEGVRAADIGTGKKATLYVPPGEINLGAGFVGRGMCNSGAIQALQSNAKPGGRSMFRISTDMNGLYLSPYFEYEGR